MATLSYDFTSESAADPISIGGDWGDHYTGSGSSGVVLVDNGGSVNAASRNGQGGIHTSRIVTSKGTYGRKQYCEITVGSNGVNSYCICPGVYLNGSGTGYYARIYDQGAGTGSNNRMYKIVSGSLTNLNWMNNQDVGAGDKVGFLADDDGAGDTTLSFYYNSSTYDGDGFPTNGFINSYTDTSTPITSGQAGLVADNTSTADEGFASAFYSAGFTAAGGGSASDAGYYYQANQ